MIIPAQQQPFGISILQLVDYRECYRFLARSVDSEDLQGYASHQRPAAGSDANRDRQNRRVNSVRRDLNWISEHCVSLERSWKVAPGWQHQ